MEITNENDKVEMSDDKILWKHACEYSLFVLLVFISNGYERLR